MQIISRLADRRLLTSTFILCCITLQVITGFGIMFKRLWPFICYPMYSAPFFKGDAVPVYATIGVAADGTEIEITPEAMGLDYMLWRRGPVVALRRGDAENLLPHIERYCRRSGATLKEIRLINRPMTVRDGKIVRLPTASVASFRLPEAP
jgi:hypothetical protein